MLHRAPSAAIKFTKENLIGEITEEARAYNLNFSLKIVIFKMLPEQF